MVTRVEIPTNALFHLLLTEEKSKFKRSFERKTKNFVFSSSLQVKGK